MFEIVTCSLTLLFLIYLFRREFLSTTFIVCFCFFVASSFCLIYKDEWAINLQVTTVNIILAGLISCFLGELSGALFTHRREKRFLYEMSVSNEAYELSVERYKIILFILLQVVVLFFYYLEVSRIAGSYTSFSVMMNIYRNATYGSNKIADNVNIVVKQLAKISYAGTVICLGVFFNNCLETKKITKNIIYLIPSIFYVALSVLESSRSDMLQLGLTALVLFYVLWEAKSNWKRKISMKMILGAVGIVVLMLVLFWLLKKAVGRTSQKAFLEYIGYYFSSGIPMFDKYISSPSSKYEGLIGAETFSGLWGFLSKFTRYNVVGHLEFRNSGSIRGNTYTAFREYYNDFGIMGVIVLEFFFSFIYTCLFSKLKILTIRKRRDYLLKTIIIAAFSYPIFFETIATQFYRLIISIGTLTYIIFIYAMYWFFFKIRIKFH